MAEFLWLLNRSCSVPADSLLAAGHVMFYRGAFQRRSLIKGISPSSLLAPISCLAARHRAAS